VLSITRRVWIVSTANSIRVSEVTVATLDADFTATMIAND